jgi:hypothetical protein
VKKLSKVTKIPANIVHDRKMKVERFFPFFIHRIQKKLVQLHIKIHEIFRNKRKHEENR